jgi:hypothetical protein
MMEDEVEYLPANPTSSTVNNIELFDDLQTIYSRFNGVGKELQRVEFIMEDNGLGTLPTNINSVGSVLLFNSSINPYKNYEALDNLVSAGR